MKERMMKKDYYYIYQYIYQREHGKVKRER